MDTELDIKNYLLIKRGLRNYQGFLTDEIAQQSQQGQDPNKISNLKDEARETAELLDHVDKIYKFKYIQNHGKPPVRL